jgi:hypothetical protein
MTLLTGAMTAMFLLLSLYLGTVLGYPPLSVGIAWLSFCAVLVVALVASMPLVTRHGTGPPSPATSSPSRRRAGPRRRRRPGTAHDRPHPAALCRRWGRHAAWMLLRFRATPHTKCSVAEVV